MHVEIYNSTDSVSIQNASIEFNSYYPISTNINHAIISMILDRNNIEEITTNVGMAQTIAISGQITY